MKRLLARTFFGALAASLPWSIPQTAVAAEPNLPPLRPPAVPLVTHDPYFSIWSPADKLTDADTVHWTGKPHRLTSLVRIDGKAFRVMGTEPTNVPAMKQTGLEVLPTRTIYMFEDGGVRLTLTFLTPALPEDLEVLARPVTYVTWSVEPADGKQREVTLYLDTESEIVVNVPTQSRLSSALEVSDLEVGCVSPTEQPILEKKGDDLRIDWGHFYVATPGSPHHFWMSGHLQITRLLFSAEKDYETMNRRAMITRAGAAGRELLKYMVNGTAANSFAFVFGFKTETNKPTSHYVMLAYDDEFSIQYFKQNLRPYWRRNGDDAAALLKKAAADYESLKRRCEQFDTELMADLRKAGGSPRGIELGREGVAGDALIPRGEKYARICALAYRQCVAANKVVADANGQPLMFPKENFSNGCIGTVDVLYPQAPLFLLLSPSLTKAMLVPILDYAASPRWKFPFAPHDLGTYPLANGQVYGGGERTEENQMPVEETGNMLILLAALAHVEGNADFCAKYWPVIEKWADYLKAKGFDPENQLCTDDFAGHLAHNVNLSAKAICGLAAFAQLCERRGGKAKAEATTAVVQDFARRCVELADDGDHYRLVFDKPGTWSQKYNTVWNAILGLNLASPDVSPTEVWRREMDFYLRHQNKYGLPLDSRKDYTKLDWTLWTATLTQDRADFDALIEPVYRFLNETPDRVPMTDWFDTKTGRKVGFQARSVVGGVFLQMLYDRAVWKKWASRDVTKAGNWAPLPQ